MANVLQGLLMTFTLLTTLQALLNDVVSGQRNPARPIANVTTKAMTLALQRELASVKSALQKQVAFTAHYSDRASSVNIQASEPFQFDVAITNIGKGYNPNSGIFIAPYSGVYLFIVTLMMDNQHSWLHAVIDKSGEILCVAALTEARYTRYDKSTCSSTTHLQAGDKVFVRRYAGDTYIRGGPYCSFTGVMISADLQ